MKRTLLILPVDVDERRLLEGLRAGEASAYRSLYVLYADKVLGLARLMLPDRLVDDAQQETFLRIFRGIDRFRSDARLGTWIHRIAVNVCLTALRRQGVRAKVEAQLTSVPQEPEDAERRCGDKIAGTELQTLLQRLDPMKRTTFWLHHVEGMSAAEIGEVLDEPRGTILKRLQRTRMELLESWNELERSAPRREEGGR